MMAKETRGTSGRQSRKRQIAGVVRFVIEVRYIVKEYTRFLSDNLTSTWREKANAMEIPYSMYIREYITQRKYKTRQKEAMFLVRGQRETTKTRGFA